MKKKLLLLLFLTVSMLSFADVPFRNHRANFFSAMPVPSGSIVFIGNSITNMHEWRDAFGNPQLLNRGISGAISDELVENLETYILNKPSKVFLMVGTNDLGTSGIRYPQHPFRNIQKIIDRIRRESPATSIYVQSILPSTNNRTKADITKTNALLKAYCDSLGIAFVDLYPLFAKADGSMKDGYSYDNLHPTAIGYSTWCKAIEGMVGSNSVYPDPTVNNNNGVTGSHGMRLTAFAQLPVMAEDVIMFGDDMQHGCEWHEVLRDSRVKNRGTGWGYASADIPLLRKFVAGTFNGRAGNAAPAKIFVYAGAADMNNGNVDFNTAVENYTALINDLKAAAPASQIYIESLVPSSDAARNANRYQPFNDKLREIAANLNVTYIDLYTPLMDNGARNPAFFYPNTQLPSGLGYVKIGEILAQYIEGSHPVTLEEAQTYQTLNNARNALGQLLSKAYDLKYDGSAGSYPAESKARMAEQETAAYALLAQGDAASVEQMKAQAAALREALSAILPEIILPQASTDENTVWYTLTSNRQAKVMHSNGAGRAVTGSAASGRASSQWKFVRRSDGTFNIINRADQSYLNPNVAYDDSVKTSATEPARGWTLSYCNTPGMFNIACGNVEINQTGSDKICNWSAGRDGADKADVGCQYVIEAAAEPVEDLSTGWYRIKMKYHNALGGHYAANAFAGCYVFNAAEEYNQNGTWWYPLTFQEAPAEPAADDAAYYVRIINTGGVYNMQSANGHYLADNATASALPATISVNRDEEGVHLASHWIPFRFSNGIILGKSSTAVYADTRYEVTPVDLAGNGLAAWTVSIVNAPAATNINSAARVTCTTSGVSGLGKVYDNGTIFLPAGVMPAPGEFLLSLSGDYDVEIDQAGKSVTLTYGKPSGIQDMRLEQSASRYFDLQGRRVARPAKGVYVAKGKKILVGR